MGALDTGYKYGEVISDKKGNIRQSVKTMGGSFDANQIVENLAKAKEFPITKIEDKNEINTKLLDELYATKEDFKKPFDILKGLSNPTSTSDGINYFSQTLPSLSSGSGTIKPSELANFKVTDKNIAHQKFSFEVLQKASSDVMVSTKTLLKSDLTTNPITSDGSLKLSFTGRDEMKSTNTVLTADLDSPIITIDGNLTLKNKDGTEDIDIALSASMTLETVANEINQNTYQTGVKAVLENDDNTGKKLVLISEIDGKIIDTTNSDASVLADLGLPDEASELTQNTIDIGVDTTMDYNEIATAINAQTKLTNIHAELVSTGKDQYKFVLTSQDTGRVINPTTSTTTVLTDLGLETESGSLTDLSTLQAKVKYKGVEVVSNTNKFELFSGLEVDVLKVEANNKFTVSIGPPIDLIADELEEFVKGMNLALSNLRMRMDSTNEESHMQSIQDLKRLENRIATTLSGNLEKYGLMRDTTKNKVGGNMDYHMVFSRDTFMTEATKDFDALKTAFAFNDHRVGDGIKIFNKPSKMPTELAGKTFNVKVTATDVNGTATKAEFQILNGETIEATIENGTIKGPKDSDFEGFEFIYYAGALGMGESTTVEFSPTYGVMNALVNVMDGMFNSTTGTLEQKDESIRKEIDDNKTKIDDMRLSLEEYKMKMILKFQRSQSRVMQADSMLQYMNAQRLGQAAAAAA